MQNNCGDVMEQKSQYRSRGVHCAPVFCALRARFYVHCAPVFMCIARPKIQLSNYEKIVDIAINNITKKYDNVQNKKYAIMPNHIHLIGAIKNGVGIKTASVIFLHYLIRTIR